MTNDNDIRSRSLMITISRDPDHHHLEGEHDGVNVRWIWSKKVNEVVRLHPGSDEIPYVPYEEIRFDNVQLRQELVASRCYSDADDNKYMVDKALRFADDKVWGDLFGVDGEQAAINDQIIIYYKSDGTESRLFVRHPLIRRAIRSVKQAEDLGLDDRTISEISMLGLVVLKWDRKRRATRRAPTPPPMGVPFHRQQYNVGVNLSASPAVNADTTVRKRPQKVPWNNIVGSKWSFDYMYYHVSRTGDAQPIKLAYFALFLAAHLCRREEGMLKSRYCIKLADATSLFRDWAIGCILAQRIAWHYSENELESNADGMSRIKRILQKCSQLRSLNMKLIKHILGNDSALWNDICGRSAGQLAAIPNMRQKWVDRLNHSAKGPRVEQYLQMFTPNPAPQPQRIFIEPSKILSIINDTDITTVYWSVDLDLRELRLFGRLATLTRDLKTCVKLRMSASEHVIGDAANTTKLVEYCSFLAASMHMYPRVVLDIILAQLLPIEMPPDMLDLNSGINGH